MKTIERIPTILDCGHAPDPGTPANVNGETVMGWQFVLRDGAKICHACDSKRILSCGHTPSLHENFTTGTAHLPDGREICYACADEMQRADLLTSDRFTGYVSSDGKCLTTWTGGRLGSVSIGHRHPWSRERSYIRAYDLHGQTWHGTGAPGMWCNLRKCKAPTL